MMQTIWLDPSELAEEICEFL